MKVCECCNGNCTGRVKVSHDGGQTYRPICGRCARSYERPTETHSLIRRAPARETWVTLSKAIYKGFDEVPNGG